MAHPELDALFNTLLPFAQTMLREHGEFYPFGATMTTSGEIRHVGAKMEDDDHPPSQPLIDLLIETFKKQEPCHRENLRSGMPFVAVLNIIRERR
jgi:hypothetical protein